MARIGYLIFRVVGWVTIAMAVILPTAITIWHCVCDGVSPADGWGVSGRQIGLLGRTILLAFPAALLAIIVAVPVAASLFRGAHNRGGRWLLALAVCPLLMSPTVMTFGWSRAIGDPAWIGRYADAACIWNWAAWLWPIPALILGTAWSAAGRSAYEAALLETGRGRAFVAGALPTLRKPLLGSLLILLVLACADYNVPHACSIQVYATELLAWATNYREPIHTLWASLPLAIAMGLIAVTAVRAFGMSRRVGRSVVDLRRVRPVSSWRPVSWIVAAFMVAVPIAGLSGRLESAQCFGAMARTYSDTIFFSVLLACAGGFLAVWSGFAAVQSGALGRVTAMLLLAAGILPGALMGKALAVTYVGVPAIYDHWPIVVLAYAGRYGWIGVAVGWFLRQASADEVEAMARVDGAGPPEVFWWLRLRTGSPALLAAWLVATGMSLTDLATAPQVTPPQFALLSVILVEKFHRFEEQMLISISLTMLALPIVAAIIVGFFARRVVRAQ